MLACNVWSCGARFVTSWQQPKHQWVLIEIDNTAARLWANCRCVVMLDPACHAGSEGVAHVEVLAQFGAGPKSALANKLEKLAQFYDVKVI